MSTIKSSTTLTTAYSVEADTTGALVIQTGATPTTAVTVSSAQVVTLANALAEASGGTGTTIGYNGFKNRIINGQMVLDQRNAGASVTSGYPVDRFVLTLTQASKLTAQQNAGAITPPAGFGNYLGITSSSAYSVLTGDTFLVLQTIEGFNTSDLGFGTASASTVTLSFRVYSSLTGTFGGALVNGAGNRSYLFSYSIPTANTWTTISVTIAGDTSGTWVGATNGIGLIVRFGLGSGATYSGTSGAWAAGNLVQPTSTVSVVGTSGATFYITGVQLEKGSTATSFDYRPYGTELQLAQRFYEEQSYQTGNFMLTISQAISTTSTLGSFFYKVRKRAAPTISASGTTIVALNAASSSAGGTIGFSEISEDGTRVDMTGASGLVAGNASAIYFSYAKIKMNAEL